MFTKKNETSTEYNELMNAIYAKMADVDPLSPEFTTLLAQVSTLSQLREAHSPKKISAETKATIAANLAGILIIVGHERANVVTSKALSFVSKLR